jgi:hypothetical protein
MIEKFASVRGVVRSEFLDLNHTGKSMILVSLMIPKFAPEPSSEHRRTSESGHWLADATIDAPDLRVQTANTQRKEV